MCPWGLCPKGCSSQALQDSDTGGKSHKQDPRGRRGGVFLSHGDLMTLGGQPCLIPSLSLQPFRCAHCHYSCNISGSLKRHYNRKHPNEEYANVGTGELAADALIQQGR